MATQATVLFDGVCNLCNASVNFIIDRDPRAYFHFAALQSDAAKQLGEHATSGDPESIVLIEDQKRYERSTAALRIARKLSGAWPLFYAFIVVPRPLRDLVYRFIAKNRYKWFGRRDACRLPSPELKARFLS
jgi:predicted DCC family thiol-disulfide oxidoreductase YuxK